MGNNLESRLARLETKTAHRQRVFVWRGLGQTVERAVAVRFPDGLPDNIDVVILGWEEPVVDVRPELID
jgi:hypothetical protein